MESDQIFQINKLIESILTNFDIKTLKVEVFYQQLLHTHDRTETEEIIFKFMDSIRTTYIEMEFTVTSRMAKIATNPISQFHSYFDWDGKPIEQWEGFFKSSYFDTHVAKDIINGYLISTVWLGLNHNFEFDGTPPLIFETMIFEHNSSNQNEDGLNDYLDEYIDRYCSYEQALDGHKTACEYTKSLPKFVILKGINDGTTECNANLTPLLGPAMSFSTPRSYSS